MNMYRDQGRSSVQPLHAQVNYVLCIFQNIKTLRMCNYVMIKFGRCLYTLLKI